MTSPYYKELSLGVFDKQLVGEEPGTNGRDARLDGGESRFFRRDGTGFKRKIDLCIVGIAVHVGEVGPNKIEKKAGIETKEKRTKTRTLRNSVFNRDIGGIRTLYRDELSTTREVRFKPRQRRATNAEMRLETIE